MTDSELLTEVWSVESYSEVATEYLSMAGRLVESTGVGQGDRALDIGTGTGNVAITAARRGAQVTGLDITPEMLDRARENARTAGIEGIEWREGDATALPFDDDPFDVTLSSLGHMYGDNPEDAATELRRVTRPGGRFGFTAWTPDSVYPSMAMVILGYLSPEDLPEYSEPPFSWGDSDVVEGRLGGDVERLDFESGSISVPFLSPAHFWRDTATRSGVFSQLLDSVPQDDRSALHAEMVERIEPYFDGRENAVTLDYLLTTGVTPDRKD